MSAPQPLLLKSGDLSKPQIVSDDLSKTINRSNFRCSVTLISTNSLSVHWGGAWVGGYLTGAREINFKKIRLARETNLIMSCSGCAGRSKAPLVLH